MCQADYHQLRRSLVLLAGQRRTLARGLASRIEAAVPALGQRMEGKAAEQLVVVLLEAARCVLHWDNVQPMLAKAGGELADVGVRGRDYELVRESWISLLAEMLDGHWDDGLENAWRSLGRDLFDAVRSGAPDQTVTAVAAVD